MIHKRDLHETLRVVNSILQVKLPLNFKESFFKYLNLGEQVADFSERSSQHFSSAVGAY